MKIATASITEENDFTDWVYIGKNTNVDYSISNSFTATVTLQRKFASGDSALDVDTFTASEESYFFVPSSAYYRMGVKTSDFSTGQVDIILAAYKGNAE